MMRTTAIYELNVIADDPRFEGFALDYSPSVLGRDSLDDDLSPGFADAEEDPRWKQPMLDGVWPTPSVEGRVAEFNDYPGVNMILPAFSERAVDALRDYLEANGEILPLSTNTKTKFFFFNILTISDALDRERARCDFWSDPPTTATDIEYFAFDKQKLEGLSIFRIHELPSSVFVTNHFVDRVESHQLKGFDFRKAWPLPEGVNWRMRKDNDQESRTTLKKNTLVLALPFDGTPDEVATFKSFEDGLDERLRVDALNSEFFGCYEGHEVVGKECRMFLSTPDADRLLQFLEEYIKRLQWTDQIKAIRRYGRLDEERSREKVTMI